MSAAVDLARMRTMWERAPVRYAVLSIGPFRRRPRDAEELRRWMTPAVPNRPQLHGHIGREGFQRYPLFQYKVTRSFTGALGLEGAVPDAVEVAKALAGGGMRLGSTDAISGRLQLSNAADVLATGESHTYRFATPWVPFNGRNEELFESLPAPKRGPFLAHLLVDHVVAFLKAVDRPAPFELQPEIDLRALPFLAFRGGRATAFSGEFRLPIRLPPLLGVGRGMAIGYGITTLVD